MEADANTTTIGSLLGPGVVLEWGVSVAVISLSLHNNTPGCLASLGQPSPEHHQLLLLLTWSAMHSARPGSTGNRPALHVCPQ